MRPFAGVHGCCKSHQRSQQPQHLLKQAKQHTAPAVRRADLLADFQRVQEVRFELGHCAVFVHPYAALEMQIQAAVIQIDAAHRGDNFNADA